MFLFTFDGKIVFYLLLLFYKQVTLICCDCDSETMSVRGAMYSLCQPRLSLHNCTDGENNTDNHDNNVIVVCDEDSNNNVKNNSLIISHKLINTEILQPSDFLPIYNSLHYLSEFEPDIFEDRSINHSVNILIYTKLLRNICL